MIFGDVKTARVIFVERDKSRPDLFRISGTPSYFPTWLGLVRSTVADKARIIVYSPPSGNADLS